MQFLPISASNAQVNRPENVPNNYSQYKLFKKRTYNENPHVKIGKKGEQNAN